MSRLGTLVLGTLVALSWAASAIGDTPDPAIGSWKLNVAKSQSRAGPALPRSETRTYSAAADGAITIAWKRVTADGRELRLHTTLKYDGKDYPVTGSPDYDALSARRVDANTVESTQKRMGKAVSTTLRTVSKDGKTLTLAGKGMNAKGEATDVTLVYDRQ